MRATLVLLRAPLHTVPRRAEARAHVWLASTVPLLQQRPQASRASGAPTALERQTRPFFAPQRVTIARRGRRRRQLARVRQARTAQVRQHHPTMRRHAPARARRLQETRAPLRVRAQTASRVLLVYIAPAGLPSPLCAPRRVHGVLRPPPARQPACAMRGTLEPPGVPQHT